MASQIERKDNSQVLLTIEVEPETFNKALQQSYRKNINRFQIPGFRRGKAPMGLVVKYYGEGVLYEDAIDFAATPAYAEAIKEHGLEPVSRPEMDIVDINKESGLKFTVLITEKPPVKLGEYLGIEAVRPEYPVDDAAVDAELKRIQERNSRLVPVEDRPIADGDTANIDYEGFLAGVPFEGGKGEGYDLRIGSKSFIPGFEDQLIGHQTGDEFDIQVTFPDDYGNEELKGQEVTFHVRINSVKVRELPELDDDLAKDVSEFETLAEYRDSIRAKLQDSAVKRADSQFEENVIEAVVKQAEVDVPHVMIHDQMDHMLEEQKQQMRYQGLELAQYLQYLNQTEDEYKHQLHEPAEQRIRTRLVLEAIGKAEQIEASDEEVTAELEEMAKQYGRSVEELKEQIGEKDQFIRDSLISRKTVALLKERATPVAPPIEEITLDKPADTDAGTTETETATESVAEATAESAAAADTSIESATSAEA